MTNIQVLPVKLPAKFPRTVIPPFRFEIVEDGLYRGAYPSMKNFRFLKRFVGRSHHVLTS